MPGMFEAEFLDLPAVERAKRYRALAEDARREAAVANGAARQSYLIIAERWGQLVADAEASIKVVDAR
jgi:hypothetical protein